LLDVSGVDGGGREFYGESFSPNKPTRTFTFSTPNAVTTDATLCNIAVAAASGRSSNFKFTLNGLSNSVRLDSISVSDFYTKAQLASSNKSYPTAADKQKVEITYSAPVVGANGYLNYIELTTTCQLAMVGNQMTFRTSANNNMEVPMLFTMTNATSATEVWNITDKTNIHRMPTTLSGSTLTFTGTNKSGIQEYIAVNTNGNGWFSPTVIGTVANQNLHALSNIDYVIICPEEFRTQAIELAQAHEEKDGITWAVATDEEVYNEFSSGTPDATAYRWLMKMLYDRANQSSAIARPRWLLLLGDGTFDNRKLMRMSGNNKLLTYQSKNSTVETKAYATDDYFGFLDNSEGESDTYGRMDIGVGRLPANTVEEAQNMVNKTIRYMRNEDMSKWKTQLIFLSDDGDNGLHTRVSEEGAERVRKKNLDFMVNKIYLDAYPQEINASGESYPLAKTKLDNLLQNGVLFLDYSGHGGYNAITNEGMMNLKSIQKMTNKNLAFWMFATCSFAHFDSGKSSAAEEAVLNPNGGAIGVLSACRTVYATQNTYINRNFCDTLFGHKNAYSYHMTVGEACAIAKNMTGNDENKMPYILLGDPAVRLLYPTEYQVKTITQVDTLHALDVQHIEGYISEETGDTALWFNGTVDITIYDKMQQITTRDNDASEGNKQTLTYNDYPNTIFSGSAKVTNGRFAYTFMTPKDIRYNYGNGRILYYTRDEENGAEGVGHFEDFVVGGTGTIFTEDTVGPTLRLYLNTPAFVDGGTTYETPRFFAEIEDEHGINTAGAGIGHDLLLIVDNNAKNNYVLNDFFTSEDGSYQRGKVSYMLSELEDGAHSLTFRAWDLLNNSSTASLNFIVSKGADPNIYSVISYPNPVQATGILNLTVNYDQPDRVMETEIRIFDMAGRLVWEQKQSNPDNVQLNMSEIGLYPSIYLYNIRMKTADSNYATASGKIVVTE
ncbi:MAG: type IX secretion system sortase PorU, partial [Paludibacteraceae bacterium]